MSGNKDSFIEKVFKFYVIKQINQLQACSVQKSRSGEKRSPAARVSPNTSFVLTSLAACFISERSTLEAGLFVN